MGDPIKGILGIGLRPAEKLRGMGRKIITRSKDDQGFASFPPGPESMFRRDPAFAPGGTIPPSTLAVRFVNPVAIVVDGAGRNPAIKFGMNDTEDEIIFIRLGWGGSGVRTMDLRPGSPEFKEAADWIFANQKEFDLRPDGVLGERIRVPRASGVGVRPAESRGEPLGESLGRVSKGRLFDRYRF
jgi:hypothetical protein